MRPGSDGRPVMAEIHCYIPIRVRITGMPDDDQLDQLTAAVQRAVVQRIALADRTVRATAAGGHLLSGTTAGGGQHERAPAGPGAPAPLFRQPEEDDPVEAARQAARNALAPLAETVPPLLDDDPQPLISWAAHAARLSWVVTKLGTTLQGGKPRFTDAWLTEFKQAREGDPISIIADEALTFEVDGLLLHAPDRVGLIGAEVYRSTYGIKYILAIEFAAALVAFTGGAYLGTLAAEAGAASESFGGLVRAGVSSWARDVYLNPTEYYATGMAYAGALSAGATLAEVVQDIREHGLHAYHIGDVAGAVTSYMEAYVMMPTKEADAPETTALTVPARGEAPRGNDIIVDAPPQFDPSTGTWRASIRQVPTGAAFDGEFDPVTQTAKIFDKKTGALVGVIRDGWFYRPDAPSQSGVWRVGNRTPEIHEIGGNKPRPTGPLIVDVQAGPMVGVLATHPGFGQPAFLPQLVQSIPGAQGIAIEGGDFLLGFPQPRVPLFGEPEHLIPGVYPTHPDDLGLARQIVQSTPQWPPTHRFQIDGPNLTTCANDLHRPHCR